MTRPTVEADTAAYAARQRAIRRTDPAYRAAKAERDRQYRARHKTPTRVTYTPPPPPAERVDWRTALDARITRCPGCDDWQFDQTCNRCLTQTNPRSAA